MDDDYYRFEDIDKLERKIALVTGANSGIGLEVTKKLISKGVTVIMACRNLTSATEAKEELLEEFPSGKIEILSLNLSSIDSIYQFSSNVEKRYDRIDFLINNAGIMIPPFQVVYDDVESQLGVNYLSHFLLTHLLFPLIENAPEGRIVQLSSIAHKRGDCHWNQYNRPNKYDAIKAYGQSKLACLVFAYELQRRLTQKRSHVKSFAAHPGVSSTNLFNHIGGVRKLFLLLFGHFIFQDAERGAEPILRAILDSYIAPGSYLGPKNFREFRGAPVVVDSSKRSKEAKAALDLWRWSEEKLGIKFFA
ncbi:SDR family NAD(P)-dependent oxidoreductase [Halosquirtibacter laminarini]|uniref:SDR family NAD(P)-dependent oxidoreductase n=1 Tax=Halosquirtibacter laminarini TaxID=3374600 RepID=A0AC61NI55_9BACT|nr:SDR family NAD(P)-dependent oxidoreductase [Prolixibacteraceae bacterium]